MEELISRLVSKGVRIGAGEDSLRIQVGRATLTEKDKQQLRDLKPEIISALKHSKVVALSYSQERIWFLAQLGYSVQYHIPSLIRIKGNLKLEALKKTIRLLVSRHESLRTSFRQMANVTVQVIHDEVDFQIEETDLSNYGGEEQAKECERIGQAFVARPFELDCASLMRMIVLKLSEDEYMLGVCMHHIISDGWSSKVLLRDLNDGYGAFAEGREPVFKPMAMQYSGYTVWQRETVNEEKLNQQLEYWKEQLSGYQDLDLPTDFPRPGKPTGRGKQVSASLSNRLNQKLRTFTMQRRTTLFSVLVATTYLLLTKYSRQKDICFGMPVANRNHRDLEEIVGLFVNTLILRFNIAEDLTVAAFLDKVNDIIISGQENQSVPIEKIIDFLQPRRDLSRTPIFQVLINYAKNEDAPVNFGDCQLEGVPTEHDTAKFDLTIGYVEQPTGEIVLAIEYSTDLFEEASILRMQEQFLSLLDTLCEHPNDKLSTLPLLTDEASEQELKSWNNTEKVVPQQCIHELFEQKAKAQPEQTAIVWGDEQVTYGELLERSGKLAAYLQAQYGSHQVIGVSLLRSPEMIIAVMAILRSGNAYLPLDPGYPADRLQHMLQDGGVPVIITDQQIKSHMTKLTDHAVELLVLEEKSNEITSTMPIRHSMHTSNDAITYVIYTSGSTGLPKGVKVTHANVVNHNYAAIDIYDLSPADRVMQFSTINFDIFVEEVFPTLLCGATLVMLDQEQYLNIPYIREVIETRNVSVVNWPTAFWHSMAEEHFAETALRMVIIGGEKAEVAYYKKWSALNPEIRVMNTYGPTETTVISLYHELIGEVSKNIPIGKPIANTQVYVMDDFLRPLPVGMPGELCIAGAGVSDGYLNREDLNKEKFVTDPVNGGKMYRTGDLVRRLPDGNMEFLGRVDQQVKVRGFRVEPGEVENALLQHEAVAAAIVIARQFKAGKQLIAYYSTTEPVEEEALKRFMQENVPDYMVPMAFIGLDELPMTPGGKVDRKALADRPVHITRKDDFVAPQTEIQQKVAALWQSLLEVEKIGIYDNFFELGGNSILATRMLSQLNRAFQCEISLTQLFENATLEQLSELIGRLTVTTDTLEDTNEVNATEHAVKENGPELTRLAERPTRIPLSYTQERLWFLAELGQADEYHIPDILDFEGSLDIDLIRRSFEYLIGRHESLRTCLRKDDDGEPYQLVLDQMAVELHHFVHEGAKFDDPALLADLNKFVKTPFDFGNGPLIRVIVLEQGPEKFMLGYCMHHIIGDGWSVNIMQRELMQIYVVLQKGEKPALPPLPLQFADYAIWQQRVLSKEKLAQKTAHWKAHLAGHQDIHIPTDFERPEVLSGQGAHETLTLNQVKTDWMRRFCKERNITLFSLMLSMVYALLNRYYRQDDLCVGIPIANRNHEQVAGLIGFFANTVVNRVVLDSDTTLEELVMLSQRELLRSQDYQDVPFSKVVDAVNPPRDLRKTPIFQVLVNYVNIAGKTEKKAQKQEDRIQLDFGTARFDLNFTFSENAADLITVTIDYAIDLFMQATIQRMLRHYELLVENLIRQPDIKVGDIDMETNVEKQLIAGFNVANPTARKPTTIHYALTINQLRYPDRIAVTDANSCLTYAELVRKSDSLAYRLIALGATKGQLVGICMERSCEMVIATLAVLKTGAAFVPISVHDEEDRIAHILADSGVAILLTDVAREELFSSVKHVLLVPQLLQELVSENHVALTVNVLPTDPACVIYNSGAASSPEGIWQVHQAITNLADFHESDWKLDASKVHQIGQFAAVGTSAAVQELFTALIKQQHLVIIPSVVKSAPMELVTYVVKKELHYLFLPTAYLNVFTATAQEMKETFPQLKQVIVAGEALKLTKTIKQFFKDRRHLTLVKQYGSSATHIATQLTLPEEVDSWQFLPTIGKLLPNVSLQILNDHRKQVPLGGIGEVYVSGPHGAETLYKTGDLARWLPNGEVELLGSIDEQVKLKGYRVALAEVEKAMDEHPELISAFVHVRDHGGGQQLVGYYTAKNQVAPVEIKQLLQKSLPDYMVPVAFRQVDVIPLQQHGKVDKRQLMSIEPMAETATAQTEAQSALQKMLAGTWKQVLGLKRVRLDDNFFDVGGHSLLAVKLVSSINKQLKDRELKVMDLMKHPTLGGLARFLEREEDDTVNTPYILEFTKRAANFIVPGMPGLADGYHDMATILQRKQGGVYGLQMKGFFGDQPLTTIEEMAAHNISLVRKIIPGGKVNLYAHSYGGTVAYEMLQQLDLNQYEVGKVVFLDSIPHTAPTLPTQAEMISIGKGVLQNYGVQDETTIRALHELVHRYQSDQWKSVLSDFLRTKVEAFDDDFFSNLLDTLMQSMAVRYQLKGSVAFPMQLVIPEGSMGTTDVRAWDDYFSNVEVINTSGNHFSMISKQYCPDWIDQLEKPAFDLA